MEVNSLSKADTRSAGICPLPRKSAGTNGRWCFCTARCPSAAVPGLPKQRTLSKSPRFSPSFLRGAAFAPLARAGRNAGDAACGAAPAGRGRPHPGGRCPAAGPCPQPRQPPAAAPPTPGLGFRAHGLPQPPHGTAPSPLPAHFAPETHVPGHPSVTAVLLPRPAPLFEGILSAFEGRPRPQRAKAGAPAPPRRGPGKAAGAVCGGAAPPDASGPGSSPAVAGTSAPVGRGQPVTLRLNS